MAGTVIRVAELSMTVLEKILESMGSIGRKIAIGIENETSSTWEALNVYFDSGTSDVVIPEYVKPNAAALYDARKTRGPVATGSVGVIAYYMKDVNQTLAVFFHVPFDYNLYDNWWDAKVYTGRKRADKDMYKEFRKATDSFKGDNGWYCKAIGEGFNVKGTMGSSGSCTLQLRIY